MPTGSCDAYRFLDGIEICSSDISQFLNVVENSIDWCVAIKSHIFDHSLTLVKHMRCYFSVGI